MRARRLLALRRTLRRSRRRRDEAGYVAILVAILLPTVFIGVAAIGVDVSRWYMEGESLQRAADAAAMAGVTYMPDDPTSATTAAKKAAKLNGYPEGADTTVVVEQGDLSSQLRVTISTVVAGSFGAALGLPSARITRTALADYTSPAPMGSPCNVFGNEPASNSLTTTPKPAGSALPPNTSNCSSKPQFWAAVEGPATDKIQGDRYMTLSCKDTTTTTHGCVSTANSEHRPEGYFFAIHVAQQAVGTPINVQLYDPAYVNTSTDCSQAYDLHDSNTDYPALIDRMNDYETTNGKNRYGVPSDRAGAADFCNGDSNPGGYSGTPLDTTFLVRQQTDTGDPRRGAVVSGCSRQFRGLATMYTQYLRQWSSDTGTSGYTYYNPQLSQVFHQWYSLCTFTPTRAGDWFLQVRTNVSLGGTSTANKNARGTSFNPVIYSGNTAAGAAAGNTSQGVGSNSFAIRAVPSSDSIRPYVAVAGYSRMPIYQNASGSTATFNLLRARPGTAGQYLYFNFFDAADVAGNTNDPGTVKILPPLDATGDVKASSGIPGCRAALESATPAAASGCQVTVRSSTHNGKVQRMIIPVPRNYKCDDTKLSGCWFRVQISFPGAKVTDFTTWEANVGGDPIRLLE